MLKILFTYDYELFLGKNHFSAQEVLFTPTEKISSVMLNQGAHGVFFADVCSAIRHRETGLNEYSDLFDDQIKKLVADRHDVQLHLHTNWYRSERVNDEIVISSDGYKIHDFGFDKSSPLSVFNIIKSTKGYLEDRCRKVDPNYRCIAYRAGGFSIQPEKQLFSALMEAGIVIDSSICPGLCNLSNVNSFDFRNVPNDLNWTIDPNQGILSKADKGILEITIGTSRLRILDCIGKRMSYFKLPPSVVKGEYVKNDSTQKTKQSRLKRIIDRLLVYRNLSLDTHTYSAIMNDLNYIYKKHKLQNTDKYLCLICHPKLVDQVRLDNISRLIQEINKHSDKYEIVTFQDVYKECFDEL